MKALEKVYLKLEGILNKHGFSKKEKAWGNSEIMDMSKGTNYVTFIIQDYHDGYQEGASFEEFRAYGHLHVTACIGRMGSEMTAEEFLRAADQMKRCGELLKELETADLSYVSLMNGEAAEEV